MQFAVASIRNVWDRDLVQRAPTWEGLCKALTTFRRVDVTDKRELPAWIPALWKPGAKRTQGNNANLIEHLSCGVLDFDEGLTPAQASARFAAWPHVWHTSFSHTLEQPKFRLVLPLARPVPVRLWALAWRDLTRHAGFADTKCKDPGRIYFVPAIRGPEQPHAAAVVDEGGPMYDADLERLEAELERAKAPAPTRRWTHDVAPRRQEREVQERLKTDPAARARAAEQLGARVVDNRATKIQCPGCGRPDVWYFIAPQPGGMRGAACNHANSCGWVGWLDELLGGARG